MPETGNVSSSIAYRTSVEKVGKCSQKSEIGMKTFYAEEFTLFKVSNEELLKSLKQYVDKGLSAYQVTC
jgi:hypothetical protein